MNSTDERVEHGKRLRVAVAGSGNVAWHLLRGLAADPATDVCAVAPRTLAGFRPDADIVLLAVSDDAVADVAAAVRERVPQALVAHTSGSVPLLPFQPSTTAPEGESGGSGVFYPLQTFTKGTPVDFAEVSIFIEADTPANEQRLRELAARLTPRIYAADSAARGRLHLAAVFACNFSYRLFTLASRLLPEGAPAEALQPLIEETVGKFMRLQSAEGQTGPAARGDLATIGRHISELQKENTGDENGELEAIYRLMTCSIMREHLPGRNI